jgi:hypothetical protein
VCWAALGGGSTSIDLYVVTSAGGAAPITTINAPSATFQAVDAVTVGYDPLTREETCWIASTELTVPRTFRLQEYAIGGTLLRSYVDTPDAGSALSIAATGDEGVVWLLRSDATGFRHLQLVQWDPAGFPILFDLGNTDLTRFFR